MTPEERLALINKTAQTILDMPDAERQAYQQKYWQAINDMLAEYNQIKASQKQQQMEARNRGDALADMYRDANGNVIWVYNDWSQEILEAAPRKETPKRRQDTPKDREVKETPIEVNTDKPELTWYKTEDPRYAKDNNNGWNWSWTWVWPWIAWWAGVLWGASIYWLYKNYGDKPKVLPPETVIPWRTPALWEVREGKLVSEWLLSDGKVTTQWPKWHLPWYSTPALWEVRDWKIVSEWLLSDGKVIVQWPKWNLPDKRNTSISQIMSRPGVYEPVEWYHTPSDIASKSKNRISQIMSRPGNFEPLEWYHNVSSTVKTETPKVTETTVKKWVKNAVKKWTKKAIKKWWDKVKTKALKLVF